MGIVDTVHLDALHEKKSWRLHADDWGAIHHAHTQTKRRNFPMLLGRVIGNVVATMKNESLVGQRLLMVRADQSQRTGTRENRLWRWIPWAPARARQFIGAAARKRAFRFFPLKFPPKRRLWESWTMSA